MSLLPPHPFEPPLIPRPSQVSPGLFMGGSLATAQRLVATGRASASDVLFYSGYHAWPIKRLEAEVAAGQWTIVKASHELLLSAAKDEHTAAREVILGRVVAERV